MSKILALDGKVKKYPFPVLAEAYETERKSMAGFIATPPRAQGEQ